MIELKNVKKCYKGEEIFSDVNLKIDKCGVYLIRGDSGCGKTTLLNIISFITSFKGMVRNDYLDNMSYVFQNSYLVNHLSIRENLDLYGIDYNVLKKYKLYDKLNDFPTSLSRGEKSRIAFIIGVYSDSQLLLIDEPITNLDKLNASFIVREIFKQGNKKIIILVSHENKMFINKVNGIIDIKNKKVKYKEILRGSSCRKSEKKKIHLNFRFLVKEFLFYKRENIKRYLLIFFIFIFMFIFLGIKSYFLFLINRDVRYSVDYDKFYLSECNSVMEKGIALKCCSNPNKENLDRLEKENIKYYFNYDLVLNSLYSRDDLFVINNKNIILKEGRYPYSFDEVIASADYSVGETIVLNSNLIVNGYKNDIYKREIKLRVVGIYHDLTFFSDSNIYFDYSYVDEYYKNEKLVNNGYSIYDYYNNLKLDNYKYLSFKKGNGEYINFTGNKYEFYSALIELYYKISDLLFYLLCFIFVYCLYIIYRLNRNKLIRTQTSNSFLIANSYGVGKSVISSVFFDFLIISSFVLLLVFLSLIFSIDIRIVYILYLLIMFLIVAQTYVYYSRKHVGLIMRLDI